MAQPPTPAGVTFKPFGQEGGTQLKSERLPSRSDGATANTAGVPSSHFGEKVHSTEKLSERLPSRSDAATATSGRVLEGGATAYLLYNGSTTYLSVASLTV